VRKSSINVLIKRIKIISLKDFGLRLDLKRSTGLFNVFNAFFIFFIVFEGRFIFLFPPEFAFFLVTYLLLYEKGSET